MRIPTEPPLTTTQIMESLTDGHDELVQHGSPPAHELSPELQTLTLSSNIIDEPRKHGLTLETPSQQQQPSLQTLPSELRQKIYSYIFNHHPLPTRSQFPYKEFTYPGCRCGGGLSGTSRLFYEETRHVFYNHARFAFQTPLSCIRFLDNIGYHSKSVGALAIAFDYSQIHLLRSLFDRFIPTSTLHMLHLEYTSERVLDFWPIYLPSVQDDDPTIRYDIGFRSESHPLSKLTSIRGLTVEGSIENVELQEAIVKLSLKVDDAALKQGKSTKKTETTQTTYFGKAQVLYGIEIPDHDA